MMLSNLFSIIFGKNHSHKALKQTVITLTTAEYLRRKSDSEGEWRSKRQHRKQGGNQKQ